MATLMASLPSPQSSFRAQKSAASPSLLSSLNRLPERRRFNHTSRRSASSRGFSMWNISNNINTQEGIAPHVEMEAIANEDNFNSALSVAQQQSKPIVIDWMASWCRKCIYLKPKLTKLATEFESDVKFYYVDVNTVPQALVKRAEVTKMPTIQVWKNGEKCGEVIGGQKAWLVIDEVRDMVQKHLR